MHIDYIGFLNTPHLIGDKKLHCEERIKEYDTTEGTYFIRKTNIEGIFTYGFQQNKEDYMGNPAGYIWSSRCGIINKVFDVALVSAYYKEEGSSSYTCCAIDLEHLKPLLEGTCYEVCGPLVEDKDINYTIQSTHEAQNSCI